MRRMLVATMVLGLAGVTAQAAITTTVTFTGTYTYGGQTIDVYDVSQDAGSGRTIGSLIIGIGNFESDPNFDPNHDDDPYQVWRQRDGGLDLWKTQTVVNKVRIDQVDPNAWLVDTHFLDPNSWVDFSPKTVDPNEVNDANYQSSGGDGFDLGEGELWGQAGIPSSIRTQTMDVAQVGVVRGKTVWGWTNSADDLGQSVNYEFLIPEPATLCVLGLGALALIRRRRG